MAVQISGNDITVPRDGTFTRNVTIGGTLTYEDVTNIDSVGLVTARTGIEIGARPGVAASISVDGNMIVSGISTFGGDVQVPDKIIHSGDTDTAIRFSGADTITAETGGSERLRITSDGKIGFSETSPSNALHISGTTGTDAGGLLRLDATTGDNFILFDNTHDSTEWALGYDSTSRSNFDVWYNDGSSGYVLNLRLDSSGGLGVGESLFHLGDTNTKVKFPTSDVISAETAGAERLRIDSSGRVLISSTNANTSGYGYNEWDPKTQILETQGLAIQRCYDGTWGGGLILASSRGSYSSPSAVQNGDRAGGIYFCSHDGTDFKNYSAAIEGIVDDSVASNDTPGKLSFQVAADGSNQLTERMSISKEGYVNNPARPAFDVTVSNGPVSNGNTIVFNEADLNNGGHYSTSNGKFTAPITGTYLFYFGGLKDNTAAVARIKLLKNDGSYIHNRELRLDNRPSASYGENAATTIICSLNSGNTVEVRVTDGTIYGGSDGYTFFGGYLLS